MAGDCCVTGCDGGCVDGNMESHVDIVGSVILEGDLAFIHRLAPQPSVKRK